MYEKQGKIQDLSLLPPCQDTFQLRSHRCNYVAKYESHALKQIFSLVIYLNMVGHNWE